MTTITGIIITKNEEANIEACLQSVLWMDNILVLDSGSTDATLEICKKYNVSIVSTDWPGFGAQKNRALDMATADWIFSIDADERISPMLQQEILHTINDTNEQRIAFHVPRQNYVLNRLVKHCLGGKHDAPIRLVKKNSAKFSDDIVHEKILVPDSAKVGILCAPLQHYPFPSLPIMLNKSNLYSTLGAQKLAMKKVRGTILKALWHTKWAFIRMYFLKLGILDGWAGFLIAITNAEETFYRYAKLIEIQRRG